MPRAILFSRGEHAAAGGASGHRSCHRPRSGEAAIRIAAGEPLPFAQQEVALRGHAIECRIYAEDPDNNFFPSPGKIASWRAPHGPGIRLDDGVYAGLTVPGDYDPLLAKLIVSGSDRAEALARSRRALGEFVAAGIKTNARLFVDILDDPDFVARRDSHAMAR